MRILLVMRNLEGDRSESAETKMIARALVKRSITVGALYRKNSSVAAFDPAENIAQYTTLDDGESLCIQKAFVDFQPDLLHIKSCWVPLHVRIAKQARKYDIPYLLEPGGHLGVIHLNHRSRERSCPLWRKIGRRIYRNFFDVPMLKHAVLTRTQSYWEQQDLESRYHVKCKTFPTGFNEEWLSACRLHHPYPRNTDHVHFVFVGRLDIFQKGLDLILEAVRMTNQAGLQSRFKITLAGPESNNSYARLNNLLLRYSLHNVTVTGPVFDVEKEQLFESADVFLHPSRFEETAKLAREAAAAGLPVIASRESNFGDWVDYEKFGLCTELSASALSNALTWFIKHPDQLQVMGGNAVRFAKRWNWDNVAAALIPLYEDCV